MAHFDEPIAPCEGSCDVCTGESIEARLAGAVSEHAEPSYTRASGGRARVASGLDANDLDADERELFEALRALRRELAAEAGVPPYIVFGDKVLLEMVARRPGTRGEMLAVPGVGQAKLERYGEAFLELLT